MRVLFVVSDRQLSPIAPGGSGTVFGGLLALLRARDDEVYLVLLRDVGRICRYEEWKHMDPAGAADLASWVRGIELVEYGGRSQLGSLERKALGIWDPQRRAYPFLGTGVCEALTEAAGRRIPDLVLAADLNAGLVASRSDLKRPLVYYHHDFFWKIRDLREGGSGGSWRGRWGLWVQRKAEERLVQSVDTCITGSTLELEELKSIGAKAVARIPPVATSEPVTIPRSAPQPCRIVHLGGLRTTATFLGLQRFLDAVWPIIRKQLPDVDFWVVGDVSIGDREMMARLKEAGAVVTGFVRDLSEVLRPGDLHVIPWEFATGVRTRVLSCFLHGQALVAIRAGVAGYEGLEDGKQCVLVDHLEELCDPLIKLAFDPERRLELAKAGRKYLKQRLTVDSVIPQFNRMMLQAVRTKQHNMDLR